MFISKKLKGDYSRYSEKWYEPISDKLHSFWYAICRPFKRLYHLYGWSKVLSNDYDWDAHSIYEILEYKLKRVERALQNGHAEQEEQHMHALRLAIKLAGRLKEDDYKAAYDRHTKKWGELITWTEPTDNPHSVAWKHTRPGIKTPQDEQQEVIDIRAAFKADDDRQNRDRRNFFSILAKYEPYWWD